jgi:hypothetical protein
MFSAKHGSSIDDLPAQTSIILYYCQFPVALWLAGFIQRGVEEISSVASLLAAYIDIDDVVFFLYIPLYFKLIRRGTGLRRRVGYKLSVFGVCGGGERSG